MMNHSDRNHKRGMPRQKSHIRAQIVDPDNGIIGTCTVLELSRAGAKLELDQVIDLPPTLMLQIKDDAELRHFDVKWQQDRCLGVEFVLKKFVRLA